MKDLNWKDCFEPAPEAFEASVRHALQTKEDKQMKRIIPRSFVIAFALILVLMATALAFGGDILNFLHAKDIGEVQIQKPDVKVEYAETGILKEIRVAKDACAVYCSRNGRHHKRRCSDFSRFDRHAGHF